ncbi:MAG TPA: PepSY domain-containing protein [Caulobacteraceae bacterium]|nr:PepSY domain-containing protein [Caulobacteraceae bacterium]
MRRRFSHLTAVTFAVLAATTAFAENGPRGGGGARGMGAQRPGPAYEAPRGAYTRPSYAAPAPRYAAAGYAPPAYAPPPEPRYAAPAVPSSRYYGAPAPFEPPLAPRPQVNSLGAQWAQQQDQAEMGVRQGRIMPLSRVVQNLARLRPGRVLDAGMETAPDGRATYRVRWAAAGGRRIDFIIDAETGAVIGRGAE